MKKRVLSLALALVLVLSLTPTALAYDGQTAQIDKASASETLAPALTEVLSAVTGWEERVPVEAQTPAPGEQHLYGAAVDEDEVYRILNSYRSIYPEGTRWTNEGNQYMLKVLVYDEKVGTYYRMTGYGCVAFCYELSDAAFGDLSARNVYSFTYDDVRVGDILRINSDTHSVIVLQKFSDHVVIAEGNYNSSVHWDRTLTRDQVMKADYITTRYPSDTSSDTPSTPSTPSGPSSAPTNVTVSTDKTSYSVDEVVLISYSADDADSYIITLWRGEPGTGTRVTAQTAFVSGQVAYQVRAAGTYTAQVEARNSLGASYATCRFSATDSEPTDTGSKPSNVTVSTDKTSYSVGETVTVSYSADDATSYNVSVWRGAYGTGTRVTSQTGFTSGKATYQAEDAGTYTVYVEAVNSNGTSSATCQFSVTGSKPTDTGSKPSNVKLTADRSVFEVDEPFYISVSGDNITGYNAELWKGAYGAGSKQGSVSGVSPNERIKITLHTAELYTIYVEAYNDYGTATATMSVSIADSSRFTDIPPNAYYMDAVNWALRLGVTEGTGDTRFSPDSTVTRGQAVTFLWRAMGRPAPTSSYNPFEDVSSTAYYYQAVLWAVENGITEGVSDTRFNPSGKVTRGQMVTLLWRTQGRPGATGQGAWYADAESWARSNNLLSGTAASYTTGAACPRSDVVYYLWNALA